MGRVSILNSRDRAMLAKADIMAGLNAEEVEAMRACATSLSGAAQDILFHEGDKATHFYCILDGYIRLFRLNGDGRDADIRICEPGDTFAECLIHSGDHYIYGAQCMDHAVLVRFSIAKIRILLEQRPAIGKAIMRSLSRHLIATMECLASDRMQTAPQRVASYLLTHCTAEGPAASLRLPFAKNLLARKLGLAPEALSRAFSTLKTSGVTVRGRFIGISNVDTLRQL